MNTFCISSSLTFEALFLYNKALYPNNLYKKIYLSDLKK